MPDPLPPTCEWTAPDSESEGLDHPDGIATKRHTQGGVTVGMYCDEHSQIVYTADQIVEDI